MPNTYWQDRILKNQAMAERLANKAVQRQAALHRDLYKDLARQVDSLFIEVTNAGVSNISRTQLWQFSKWKALMDKNYAGFNGLAKAQISKLVPEGVAYLAHPSAVTLFVKKDSEVEQARDAEKRTNTVIMRRVGLCALTDATKIVKILEAEEEVGG